MNKSGHVVHGWIRTKGSDFSASAINAVIQEYMEEERGWEANNASGLLSAGIFAVMKPSESRVIENKI